MMVTLLFFVTEDIQISLKLNKITEFQFRKNEIHLDPVLNKYLWNIFNTYEIYEWISDFSNFVWHILYNCYHEGKI